MTNKLTSCIKEFIKCEDGIATSQVLFVAILLIAPSTIVMSANLTIGP